MSDGTARMMIRIPHYIDKCEWMLKDPAGYWAFARHLARQHARMSLGMKRKPAHREGWRRMSERGVSNGDPWNR